MTNQQAGWYPDPAGNPAKLRYWNGMQWTDDFTDAPPQANQGTGYGNPGYTQPAGGQVYYPPAQVMDNGNDATLRLIAFIFCIVSTVTTCWLIIPLAWMIPMTVRCWGIYKGTKPNTTAFGVCTLLFVTIVGGILLLISKKDA